ncbi:hypothetical protein L210DRAFT_3507530 [Boletus edulis BED1]|uniref:Uncharacterized protein n=1 Tax=Boletus edulis BED1 TaxID=1328754 RepID=A0AAD4GA52_BOLED|nr:hypothetical protein L210DRAFT_3507530 [Boletus edulis BED1]
MFYSIWVMFTHPRPVNNSNGEVKPTLAVPPVWEYPFLLIKSVKVCRKQCPGATTAAPPPQRPPAKRHVASTLIHVFSNAQARLFYFYRADQMTRTIPSGTHCTSLYSDGGVAITTGSARGPLTTLVVSCPNNGFHNTPTMLDENKVYLTDNVHRKDEGVINREVGWGTPKVEDTPDEYGPHVGLAFSEFPPKTDHTHPRTEKFRSIDHTTKERRPRFTDTVKECRAGRDACEGMPDWPRWTTSTLCRAGIHFQYECNTNADMRFPDVAQEHQQMSTLSHAGELDNECYMLNFTTDMHQAVAGVDVLYQLES